MARRPGQLLTPPPAAGPTPAMRSRDSRSGCGGDGGRGRSDSCVLLPVRRYEMVQTYSGETPFANWAVGGVENWRRYAARLIGRQVNAALPAAVAAVSVADGFHVREVAS